MKILKYVGLVLVSAIALHNYGAPSFTMRIDDNHPVEDWERVAETFGSRGIRISFAIVPSTLSEEQGACLRKLVAKGHIMMDHTPNHAFYQATYHDRKAFDLAKTKPFVVEVDEKRKKLYFRYEQNEAHPDNKHVQARIDQNVIYFDKTVKIRGMCEFVKLADGNELYGMRRKGDGYALLDFWGRPLTKEINHANIAVTVFAQAAIQPCDDILRELATISRERFDHFGLPRPTIWVRPGGWEPGIAWDRLERIYGREFGYIGADSVINIKRGTNRWSTGYDAMYFFDQGADITPEQLISKIEQNLANGKYHVTLSHMWHKVLPGHKEEWFAKTERFAQLLVEHKIPVMTMPETLKARFGALPSSK